MSKIIWDESALTSLRDSEDVAAAILKARGLKISKIKEFLNPDYDHGLSGFEKLPDIKKATKRIEAAIKKNQRIVIYGDYDIDGLSATALLNDALSQMGADVEMYIPDRFEEGYGLNKSALLKLHKRGADLVISVDCGTTAREPIKAATNKGLDVIVTDHHEPDGSSVPECVACVNPKLTQDENLSNLAGVGVAFYLVRALQAQTGLIEPGQEKWLLDLVALGTVCDVVPLVGDNRVLASYGLKVLQKSRRRGVVALCESAGVDLQEVNEVDLGFKLGPRLNAAGRLTHAQQALELLTTNDKARAVGLAAELNQLNTQRQEETKRILEEANKLARKYRQQPILVLSDPSWSHGIVGIVASRVAEKWHKPTILIQEMDGLAKGSARSFNSFNIIEAIKACSESLDAFGGHSFAAGVSLKPERIEEFRYRLNEYATRMMDVKNNFRIIKVGLDTNTKSPSLEMYEQLIQLAPFGNSNPRPVMKHTFNIARVDLVGSDASHLRLTLLDQFGQRHTAIGFGMAQNWPWLTQGETIELAYELTENIWNSNRTHQLEIVDIRKTNN